MSYISSLILNVVCQEVVVLMLLCRIFLEVHTLAIMFPKLYTQASICNRVMVQRFFHTFIAAVGDSIRNAALLEVLFTTNVQRSVVTLFVFRIACCCPSLCYDCASTGGS